MNAMWRPSLRLLRRKVRVAAFGTCVAASAAFTALAVSTCWWEVRVDYAFPESRCVLASLHGMLHFQWHDQVSPISFPEPGAYWRLTRRQANWVFLNVFETSARTDIRTVGNGVLTDQGYLVREDIGFSLVPVADYVPAVSQVFVSFPLLGLSGLFGVWPVISILRRYLRAV